MFNICIILVNFRFTSPKTKFVSRFGVSDPTNANILCSKTSYIRHEASGKICCMLTEHSFLHVISLITEDPNYISRRFQTYFRTCLLLCRLINRVSLCFVSQTDSASSSVIMANNSLTVSFFFFFLSTSRTTTCLSTSDTVDEAHMLIQKLFIN